MQVVNTSRLFQTFCWETPEKSKSMRLHHHHHLVFYFAYPSRNLYKKYSKFGYLVFNIPNYVKFLRNPFSSYIIFRKEFSRILYLWKFITKFRQTKKKNLTCVIIFTLSYPYLPFHNGRYIGCFNKYWFSLERQLETPLNLIPYFKIF